MKDTKEVINEAVKRCQGKGLKVGITVAHPSDPTTYELNRFEGDMAVFRLKGKEKRFPRSECFDPNEVLRVARCLS